MKRRAALVSLALSLTPALGATLALPSDPGPARAPLLSWTPEVPTEGHLFTIRLTPLPGDEVASVRGTIGREPLHFRRLDNGDLESLAAIPVGTTDSLAMSLTVEYRDGAEEPLSRALPVAPGQYRHRRLTVAPEFGRPPDSAQMARRARDAAKANEVSRQAHRIGRVWDGEAVRPRNSIVTSGFGDGREFNGQITSRHMGLDLRGDMGDTVVAAARGVVALVDEFLLAGNIVYLIHGDGLLTGYFHLSRQLVEEGDTVEAGSPIGLVGATGRVTGPHLHWVVRYGFTSVDPRSFPGLPAAPESSPGS